MRNLSRTSTLLFLILLVVFTACTAAPTGAEQGVTSTEAVSSNTITVTQGVAYLSQDGSTMTQIDLSVPLSEAQIAATTTGSSAEVQLTNGTLIRLGESTRVQFFDLSENGRLTLGQGTVWITLAEGSLVVVTDLGAASVTGSYLGVTYNFDQQTVTATCLEGTCSLDNDAGSTDLITGQAAEITATDTAPSAARDMSTEEVDAWVAANPNAAEVAGRSAPSQETQSSSNSSGSSLEQEYSDIEWVDYYFENNCTDSPQDGSEWVWTFSTNFSTGAARSVTGLISVWVGQGTISTGRIPRVDYATITEEVGRWVGAIYDLSGHTWSNVSAAAIEPYYLVLCPNEARLTSSAPGYPTPTTQPAASTTYQPIPYYFGNNCFHSETASRNHTNWHWSFTAVDDPNGTPASGVSTEIVVPPGEARTGELPGGYYQIRDWTEDNSVDHDTYQDMPTNFYVNLCPDEPALPGAPSAEPTVSTTAANPQPAPTQPTLNYDISFGCQVYGYTGVHYLFVGPVTTQIDVALGETESGSLPPGQYLYFQWYDGGSGAQYAPSWQVDTSIWNTIHYNSCGH